jgi:autotransporter strand-loop-strand O-heptosyltransferase
MKRTFITHTTENYEDITINLVESIKKYSKYPIVVYTIDYNASKKLLSKCDCIRIDCNLPIVSEKDFVLEKGNSYVKRETLRTFLTLSSKIDSLIHASENGFDEWVYLDSDCVANYNVDDLFTYVQRVGDYPLASLGPLEVILVADGKGSYKGNPWWKNDGTYDPTATLEWPLMKFFQMEETQRGDYCTTNIIVGKPSVLPFLRLWKNTKEVIASLPNFFEYAPLHEETIYNVLTWRNFDFSKTIPMSYINITSCETVKHFFETTVDKDTHITTFYKIPKDKSKIKIFHGEKRTEEITKVFDLIDKKISKTLKVLFLAPHLSTGGMPGFILKRIESLQKSEIKSEIFVVEYNNLSNEYVVQKNIIKSLLPQSNFYTLGENKMQLIDILKNNQIDILHIDDMVETLDFNQTSPYDLMNAIYSNDRTWRVIETCHNVSFQPQIQKIFNPDGYAFCSPWHLEKTFSMMKSPKKLIEFPLEKKLVDKERKKVARTILGLNQEKIHIINVGLWTAGKNQREGLKVARLLEKTNPEIEFHFIGNLAPNFQYYWEPLVKNIPKNVTIWGERADAQIFMEACDIFMFNSTWECSPLVLKESISLGKKVIARNLTEYMNTFKPYITEIDDDPKKTANTILSLIKKDVTLNIKDGLVNEFANSHIDFYQSVLKNSPLQNEIISSNVKITNHYIEQPFLEIKGNSESKFLVKFFDEQGTCHYENTIKSNHWVKLSKKYFTKWTAKVWENEKLIYNKTLDYSNQRVYIAIDSKSLGDTIAWVPYALEFQKKHNCKVVVSTFWNNLFKQTYSELEFIEPGQAAHGIYGMYKIGWFYDFSQEPELPNTIPLQKAATNILGLDFEEIKTKIDFEIKERPLPEKYVTIATNSTAGLKFWTREGWQSVINHLVESGYKVINVSKEDNPLRNVSKIKDTSIENTMNYIYHSEFFIGLSSGLSWLAWGLGKKVVMISNFTDENHEFNSNCYRVVNKNVCNSCWNKSEFKFDRGDWNWCPLHKNTPRHFECHKSITSEMVLNKIKILQNEKDIHNI